jgi:hypothetical protein
MRKRAALKGALNGFLGTYTSRYSAYDGYWLFGYLVEAPPVPEIDLLDGVAAGWTHDRSPAEAARLLAVDAFMGQLSKAGLWESDVREARLTITVARERIEQRAGTGPRLGHMMTFDAEVIADTGRIFIATRTLFVAPHDPAYERQGQTARRQTLWTARP